MKLTETEKEYVNKLAHVFCDSFIDGIVFKSGPNFYKYSEFSLSVGYLFQYPSDDKSLNDKLYESILCMISNVNCCTNKIMSTFILANAISVVSHILNFYDNSNTGTISFEIMDYLSVCTQRETRDEISELCAASEYLSLGEKDLPTLIYDEIVHQIEEGSMEYSESEYCKCKNYINQINDICKENSKIDPDQATIIEDNDKNLTECSEDDEQIRKVNILGTEYTIILKEMDGPSDGYTDWTAKTITVQKFDDDESIEDIELKYKDQYQNQVLRHEIIHAFMTESGLGDQWEHKAFGHEETVVDWIAYQFPKIKAVFEELEI